MRGTPSSDWRVKRRRDDDAIDGSSARNDVEMPDPPGVVGQCAKFARGNPPRRAAAGDIPLRRALARRGRCPAFAVRRRAIRPRRTSRICVLPGRCPVAARIARVADACRTDRAPCPAFPRSRVHQLDQHVRKGVAGHRAVRAALHSKSRNSPPLPHRIESCRMEPSASKRRSARSFRILASPRASASRN